MNHHPPVPAHRLQRQSGPGGRFSRRDLLAMAGAWALAGCGGGGGEGSGGGGSGAGEGRFTAVPSMLVPRDRASAVRLADGRVLVAGGRSTSNAGLLTSAEIYDPAAARWSATGSLNAANWTSFLVALSNGMVLAVGGQSTARVTELYDPGSGRWTRGADSPLAFAGSNGTLTLLADGRVLALPGGATQGMLYTPTTGLWSTVAGFDARQSHASTRLSDGRVLVSGGFSGTVGNKLSTAVLFSPANGTWQSTGTLRNARHGHFASRLADGRVLISHGVVAGTTLQDTSEIYNPSSGAFGPAGNILKFSPSTFGAAGAEAGGRWLVLGGSIDGSSAILDNPPQGLLNETNAEAFDAGTSTWQRVTPGGAGLVVPRLYHVAVALADGRVLVAGGYNGNFLSAAEIWQAGT